MFFVSSQRQTKNPQLIAKDSFFAFSDLLIYCNNESVKTLEYNLVLVFLPTINAW